jgi:hypothetical protein
LFHILNTPIINLKQSLFIRKLEMFRIKVFMLLNLLRWASSSNDTWDVATFTDTIDRVVTLDGEDEADFYFPIVKESERNSLEGEFPLIVFLQGGLVDKSLYSKFSTHLASYGYVVVVPNHLQQLFQDVPPGLWASQWTLKEALEDMKIRQASDASPLFKIVNTDIAGISGHSNGGAAALFSTTSICQFPFCFDSNYTRPMEFQASVVLGTHTVPVGGPPGQQIEPLNVDNEIPVGLINGELDSLEKVCKSWPLIEEEKDLVIIEGVNHWGPVNIQNPPSNTPTPFEQTKSQDWSIGKSAYWTGLLFDAYLKSDAKAITTLSENKGERDVYLNRHCSSKKSSKSAKSLKKSKPQMPIIDPVYNGGYETDSLLKIIDNWLKENNLNFYGDPFDTVYTGGTPLFDESTGTSISRFSYLMEKFPDQPWIK